MRTDELHSGCCVGCVACNHVFYFNFGCILVTFNTLLAFGVNTPFECAAVVHNNSSFVCSVYPAECISAEQFTSLYFSVLHFNNQLSGKREQLDLSGDKNVTNTNHVMHCPTVTIKGHFQGPHWPLEMPQVKM